MPPGRNRTDSSAAPGSVWSSRKSARNSWRTALASSALLAAGDSLSVTPRRQTVHGRARDAASGKLVAELVKRLTMMAVAPPLLLASVLGVGCRTGGPGFVTPSSPYVVTPGPVGLQMLRLADVTSSDVVYDLGSGDGRLVVAAAQVFGARGVGIELDASLISQSDENAYRAGVSDRVTFLWRDFFASDIGSATVVTLYLSESTNLRLRPKLLRELSPGARVVSHAFTMGDWR